VALADSFATVDLIEDIEQTVWIAIKPKLAAWVYAAIDADPEKPIFTFKHSFWGIPLSVTVRAKQIKPVVEWILGADPRGPEAA